MVGRGDNGLSPAELTLPLVTAYVVWGHPVMEQKKARYLNQWGFSRITQGSASTSSSGAGCGTARGTPAPPPLLLPAAAG